MHLINVEFMSGMHFADLNCPNFKANLDLLMRAFEERKSKHDMLQDAISWEAISKTRSKIPIAAQSGIDSEDH